MKLGLCPSCGWLECSCPHVALLDRTAIGKQNVRWRDDLCTIDCLEIHTAQAAPGWIWSQQSGSVCCITTTLGLACHQLGRFFTRQILALQKDVSNRCLRTWLPDFCNIHKLAHSRWCWIAASPGSEGIRTATLQETEIECQFTQHLPRLGPFEHTLRLFAMLGHTEHGFVHRLHVLKVLNRRYIIHTWRLWHHPRNQKVLPHTFTITWFHALDSEPSSGEATFGVILSKQKHVSATHSAMQKRNETRWIKCTQIAPAFPRPSGKHKPTFEVKGNQAANLNLFFLCRSASNLVTKPMKMQSRSSCNQEQSVDSLWLGSLW